MEKIASLVIYSLVFVLGVLGNGAVIWVTGFKMKKTVNTVWYLNLAVADFLVTAFLPLHIAYIALDGHWPFGRVMCKIEGAVFYMKLYASIYVLTVISVDRFASVVHPVWAQNHRSVRKASWVSLGVWALGLALSSPYLVFRDTRRDGDGIITCYDNFTLASGGAMVITGFLMAFVVPFAVIVSCYSVIVYRLRNIRQSARPLKIIATVVVVFFLCWAPFHIMHLIVLVNLLTENIDSPLQRGLTAGLPIAIGLALLNSCLNPLLYVFMGQDFRDVFRSSVLKVLEKAFTEEPSPQTNNTSSTNPGRSVSQETGMSEIKD